MIRRGSTIALAALLGAFLVLGVGCGLGADDDGNGSGSGSGDETDTSVRNPDDDVGVTDGGDGDTGSTTTGPTDTSATGGDDTNGSGPGGDDTGGSGDTGTQDSGGGGDTSGRCTFFPDSCGNGQNCYITQQGRQCLQYNSNKSVGDSCSSVNDCGDGQICTQDMTCVKRCDPDASSNSCSSDATCAQIADQNGNALPIGICQQSCTLWPNDSCSGSMEKCVPTQSGKLCVSHGSKGAGESCTNQAPLDCKEGLLCYQGSCTKMCEDGSRCGSGASCTSTGQGFSLCI